MSEYWDDEFNYWIFPSPLHYVKQRAPFEGHYANKNEAKALRRIMARTGLTEKEVRSIKKYRIELSEAQKKKGSKTRVDRRANKLIRSITKEFGLPRNHPKVIEEFYVRVKNSFLGMDKDLENYRF